jgi:DnaJ-class molecular chaperone
MPATPQEALQVLGASPDAAIEVIKKIVDGLRQSWHPDLAKSEDDRLYREQRVKQINVAWDILAGRRSAA